MSKSPLEDAFGHHVWATLQLLDACAGLSPEQMAATVPGTYGSIIDTLRHLIVGGDSWYLFLATGDRGHLADELGLGLPELRAVMERNGEAWSRLLASGVDPDATVHDVDEDDGFEQDLALGVLLAQALHHGTDHRSQICTALSSLGVEPPNIDVWQYGLQAGRVVMVKQGRAL